MTPHVRGAWSWVFNNRNRAIGLVEQLDDDRWRALHMSGAEIGTASAREGAIALVKQATDDEVR
jgi:hypothetical protein